MRSAKRRAGRKTRASVWGRSHAAWAGIAASVCLLVALSLWNSAAVEAQGQTSGGLSSEQISKINAVFRPFENRQSPGCALGVIRNDRLVYQHGYGMASIELGVPITPETVFDLGSVSKQFTASSIFLLQQEGKLSVDDEIHKYLPELPDYGHPITIRELLHHTSGIRDYIDLLMMAGIPEEDVTTDGDALAILTRQKELNFAPGAEFLYSNSGYFLLSQIIKRVAGEPLRAFAATHIFAPLHMSHTMILDSHTKIVPGRAISYAPHRGGGFQLEMSNWEQTGDGAVQTTVGDLARWDGNFYDPVVGGKELIRELQTRGRLNDGGRIPYAAGLVVDRYRGLRRVEHQGAWAGFRADLTRFPDQRVSIITLCNLANANPGAKARRVADILLAGQLQPKTEPAAGAAPSIAEMQRLAGLYWSEERQQVLRVATQDGKFTIRADGWEKARELNPATDGTYFVPDTEFRVRFEPGGAQGRMEVREGTGRAEEFSKVEEARPNAEQKKALTGRYHSAELQVTWDIEERDGKLVLRVLPSDPNLAPDAEKVELRAATENVFTGQGLVITFERRASAVAGFTVSSSGSRRIAFRRVP